MEITVVDGTDGPICWLLESPEPLRWCDRTSLLLAHQELTWGGGGGRFDIDLDTIRLHRRAPQLAGNPAPAGDLRLPALLSRNLGGLKLTNLDVDDAGGSHVELLVGVTRDLTGVRIQLRRGADDYVDWFTFPRQALVAKAERVGIYEETDPADLPPSRGGMRVFATAETGLRTLAQAGTVLRVLSPEGIVEEIIPLHPVLSWVDVDPGRLRLVHTTDTRKALLFIAGSMGLPAMLAPGAYRMTFTFQRDLGSPETTRSRQGDTTPEVATISFTMPEASS
jgi:hypothetical protein